MDVRRLRAGEGARLREIRLRALREAPYAFSSSLEVEEGESPEVWDGRAGRSGAGRREAIFVADDGGVWRGMAGAYLHAGDGTAAGVWGMWVAPDARRRGVGRALVEAVAGWARTRGATRLELSVTDRAGAATALYAGLGFEPTGERRALPSDPALVEIFMRRHL
jgi:GNAT superfamily N-acetyltransferase